MKAFIPDLAQQIQFTLDAGAADQKRYPGPREWKLVALRETALPGDATACDTPARVADYYRANISGGTGKATHNADVECFYILVLTSRRHVKGHVLISTGSLDTLLVHPREVFRPAIVAAAAAIILIHNHPSGDPTPSEADIKVTRDLIRAGQLLKIDVLDHVIIGNPNFVSLRELGYFYQGQP